MSQHGNRQMEQNVKNQINVIPQVKVVRSMFYSLLCISRGITQDGKSGNLISERIGINSENQIEGHK